MKKGLYITLTFLFVLLISGCVEIQPSEVTSVTVNFTPKTAYLVDEEVVLDNYEVEVFFDTRDSQTFTLDDTDVTLVGGFYVDDGKTKLDTGTHGDKSLTISYGGVSVSLEYSVYDAIVTTNGYTLPGDTSNSTGQTTPINSAIDAVAIHAWIFVESGEYNEYVSEDRGGGVYRHHGIFINGKPVHLRASDYVYLEPQDESGDPKPVFSIIRINNNAPVTIEGFILADSWKDFGVFQYSTGTPAPLYFLDNHINASETTGNGISLQFDGSGSVISGNTIYTPSVPESLGWDGIAMLLATSAWTTADITDVSISGNTIIRSLDPSTGGIAIQQNNSKNISNINITNNILSGGTQGAVQIQTDGTGSVSDITISNNTFTQCSYGIYLDGTNSEKLTNFTVNNNIFSNDTGGAYNIIGAPTSLMDSIDYDYILENNDWDGKTPERVISSPTGAWTYLHVPEED